MTTNKAVHVTHKGDDEKLKELILLLARASEGDPNFGTVKLNKELFYSDFLAYRLFGKAITGHEYIALELGPGPKHKLRIVHEEKCRRAARSRRAKVRGFWPGPG